MSTRVKVVFLLKMVENARSTYGWTRHYQCMCRVSFYLEGKYILKIMYFLFVLSFTIGLGLTGGYRGLRFSFPDRNFEAVRFYILNNLCVVCINRCKYQSLSSFPENIYSWYNFWCIITNGGLYFTCGYFLHDCIGLRKSTHNCRVTCKNQ
jgi:hypothetical protein